MIHAIKNIFRKTKVSDVMVEYRKDIMSRGLKTKTMCNKNADMERITEYIGNGPINLVRPLHISNCIRDMQSKHIYSAARGLFYTVCDFFDFAVQNGYVDTNPARVLRTPIAKVRRNRLSEQNMRDILECSKGSQSAIWLYNALCLALISGQRRADISKMKFDDIKDGFLFVIQQKTGARIALPIELKLNAFNLSLSDIIYACKKNSDNSYIISRKNGSQVQPHSLTHQFSNLWKECYGEWASDGFKPSFHEIRSLSERLYREQGVDTQTLLGHKSKTMTDMYNNDRGLNSDKWKFLLL